MSARRRAGAVVAALVFGSGAALGAEPSRPWSFGASVFLYDVPEGDDYAQPTFTADRDRLHLEGRYNYEELDTGSVWGGYNLSGGRKIAWDVTPMLGGVFGDLSGIAPGYTGSVSVWKVELYSEGEYVFDLDDSTNGYFYNWSELSLAPVDWFRFGVVTQRTRVYESDRTVERGLLLGFSTGDFAVTGYVFDPDDGDSLVVLGIGWTGAP